ncbi:hypothetical protein AVEN_115052-1 [Araneus ventricosus]|uniref:DUF4817 domain-containing protein n=1 Tax=Araneus ventricosus TaxID=182803 RepID=A0A4Y1ZX03_ARAVE|nr:hypothetical protein AVEN_115052-1 [Araneus ventricosus]
MTLTTKQYCELAKLYYLNGQKGVVKCDRLNHQIRRGSCSLQVVLDMMKQIEETGCTFDKSQSGRPSVSSEVVSEVQNTMTADHMQASRTPKTPC